MYVTGEGEGTDRTGKTPGLPSLQCPASVNGQHQKWQMKVQKNHSLGDME